MYSYTISTAVATLSTSEKVALDNFAMAEAISKKAYRRLDEAEKASPAYQDATQRLLAAEIGSPELRQAVADRRAIDEALVEYWNWCQATNFSLDMWKDTRGQGLEAYKLIQFRN